MKQRPIAVGLFLCDQIVVEEGTRNFTPVNCFTIRRVERFPSEPFPFVVFAQLTDGMGEFSMGVVIQRLDDLEEVYWAEAPFRFTDPLHSLRLTLRIRDCSFPVPGYYQVVLLTDGELTAHKRIGILQT